MDVKFPIKIFQNISDFRIAYAALAGAFDRTGYGNEIAVLKNEIL